MVQYDRYVLNKLLDTYESSLLSTGGNKRNIHIEFRFTKKSLPAYFDESSSEYERIHFFMEELEEKRLIRICWKGKKEGHIIAKVQLNAERLEEAYRMVSSNCLVDAGSSSCINSFTDLCSKSRSCRYLTKDRQTGGSGFLIYASNNRRCCFAMSFLGRAIEENQTQLYIREFSILHFQDSKAFEKMEGRIAHVLRKFKEGCEGAAYDEILAEYGIYHTPNYVYLKGNVPLIMRGERIDLSVFSLRSARRTPLW